MNEIAHSSDTLNTVYAHVFRFSDKFIYVTGSGTFEAVGTWNDARAQACDIPMSPQGDTHFADFPAVARDTYFVQIKLQAGGSPDTDDLPDGQGVMYWDGSKEINMSTEVESWLKNG
jgi:hypothetical protein